MAIDPMIPSTPPMIINAAIIVTPVGRAIFSSPRLSKNARQKYIRAL
jgi:hypothetical protein